jgi:DNA gyrase subunit A
MITTTKGKIIRIAAKGISIIGRSTQGVRLMDIEEGEGEKVADIALIAEREEEKTPE